MVVDGYLGISDGAPPMVLLREIKFDKLIGMMMSNFEEMSCKVLGIILIIILSILAYQLI